MSILEHIKTPVAQDIDGYGYIYDADGRFILRTVTTRESRR